MGCWGNEGPYKPKAGECSECGADVDEDGVALDICSYSPVVCEKCGWAPCDGSC